MIELKVIGESYGESKAVKYVLRDDEVSAFMEDGVYNHERVIAWLEANSTEFDVYEDYQIVIDEEITLDWANDDSDTTWFELLYQDCEWDDWEVIEVA
jgi:hypothetical protein